MDRNTVFGTVPDLMASVEYVMWNTLQFSFFKYTAPFLFFSLSLYPFWRCALLFVKLATHSVEKITRILFGKVLESLHNLIQKTNVLNHTEDGHSTIFKGKNTIILM